MGALIELVDPNNAGVNGRGSASRILRTRGFAQSDGDTAVLAVTLVSETGSPVSISGGGGGGSVSTPQPTNNTAVAAAASAAAAKSTAGYLYGVVVTSSGTAPLTITDGPSGPVIAIVPANQPIGDLPMYSGGGRPFNTSLYVNSGANTPAVTLIYS